MKIFTAFVYKEFLHIFRDKRTLLILFGIPFVQILIFGFVVTTEVKNVEVVFLDLSRDQISTDIIHKMTSSGFFINKGNITSYKEIDQILKQGLAKTVVIFENNFSVAITNNQHTAVTIVVDASEPNSARLSASYASALINQYQNAPVKSNAIRPLISTQVRMFYNPQLKDSFMFVPGVISLILMLICALMTSVTITREKEFGTMEILLVSPLNPFTIILGKIIPYLFLSFANVVFIIVLATLVFQIPIQGNIVLLFSECTLYIALALCLGIFISTIAQTMQQAMFISMIGLLLPSILLSGFIFPIENMPRIYYYISLIMPPRWFIIIFKNIMIKGTSFLLVWKESVILVVMCIFFIGASVRKFKLRLD